MLLPPPGPGTDLPVRAALPELARALAAAGTALLVAPPGTGKTTLVPLALADALADGGRVVVAEPRRVAVRAAARRMASLLGEEVGQRVGYSIRGDRRTGPGTRVEVVTTGVLLRRLQRDPELPGTAVLVLDEVHERHLDADLCLAFAVDVRAALRPDLALLATSATPDVPRIAAALTGGTGSAPVVTASAVVHPLDVEWAPPPVPLPAPLGLRVDPRILDHVASVVRRALAEREGDLLVFLPGAAEVDGVRQRLARGAAAQGVDLLALHGRQSGAEQDAALRLGPRRRVVLATAVAESSLTVPGVRTVVDSGWARVPRTDHARGLGGLATVRVSRASADQRAGRAAREGPGAVYRCWSAPEHEQLLAQPAPEVASADLTGFVLALAGWSSPDGAGLALPDRPPAGAVAAATGVLERLGLLEGGRVTDRGRDVAALGLEPRWGRALLDGSSAVGQRTATEVVALLSEDGLAGREDDLAAAWRALRAGADPARTARWRAEVERLKASLRSLPVRPVSSGRGAGEHPELAAGAVVALAHPERLARARRGGDAVLTAGGTALRVRPGSPLAGAPWLAVAVADRAAGSAEGQVRLAVALDDATALEVGADQVRAGEEVVWSGGDVVARSVRRLGAIELSTRPLADPPREQVAAALAEGLRTEGLGLLRWSEGAVRLRERLACCALALGEPWPDVSDAALLARTDDWIGPELARARRRADLTAIDVTSALRRLLPWPAASRLEELVPERLPLPGGGSARLDYADPAAPVLAVRLQHVLGWRGAPRVADGRVAVVVHLLSPAGRPLAVTADLASFWAGPYRDVRAQMRGRYPKHAWPEDPLHP